MLSKRHLSRFIVLAFGISFGCAAALACSVCPTGKDEARSAYYGTTVLLSLLPLFMVGGLIFYVVKKSR